MYLSRKKTARSLMRTISLQLMKAIVLTGMATLVLSALIPCGRRAFGKDWIFCAPGALLALECVSARMDPSLFSV